MKEKQQSESAGSESVDGYSEATEDGTYGQTNDAADTADSQKNNDTGKNGNSNSRCKYRHWRRKF